MKALALLLLSGCGLGLVEGGSGGGDNLPTLGAGPYARLEPDLDTLADEPFVVADRDDDFSDPACLARPGGGYRLWFTASLTSIGYAEVGDLHALPEVGPAPLFEGTAPSVAAAPDGTLEMWFERAGGTIGVARSSDDGATWDEGDEIAEGTDPAVAFVDGERHLFVEREGMIWHDDVPLFAGGEPHVLVETSDAGRHHWGLWFTRVSGEDTAVFYAGSFDGVEWEALGGDPVLVAPAGGPCVVLERAQGTLFFHEEQRLHLGVAAARHP